MGHDGCEIRRWIDAATGSTPVWGQHCHHHHCRSSPTTPLWSSSDRRRLLDAVDVAIVFSRRSSSACVPRGCHGQCVPPSLVGLIEGGRRRGAGVHVLGVGVGNGARGRGGRRGAGV